MEKTHTLANPLEWVSTYIISGFTLSKILSKGCELFRCLAARSGPPPDGPSRTSFRLYPAAILPVQPKLSSRPFRTRFPERSSSSRLFSLFSFHCAACGAAPSSLRPPRPPREIFLCGSLSLCELIFRRPPRDISRHPMRNRGCGRCGCASARGRTIIAWPPISQMSLRKRPTTMSEEEQKAKEALHMLQGQAGLLVARKAAGGTEAAVL